MSQIDVFKRYEYKYMLDADSKAELLEVLDGHMKLDEYGRTTTCMSRSRKNTWASSTKEERP